MQILQGPPGSLTASVNEIVTTINDALAADPALKLRGALSGDTVTMTLTADPLNATQALVRVDDTDVAGGALVGVYAAALDAAGNVLEIATEYLANNASAAVELTAMIQGLEDSDVLLLVTAGDAKGIFTGGVQAELLAMGATSLVSDYAGALGNVAYAFVGRRDGSRALELFSSNQARLATALIDGAILGAHSEPDAAQDLACSGCIGPGHIATDSIAAANIAPNAVGTSEIANNSVTAPKVAFNYAGSASEGGAASDLSCSGCVASSDIAPNAVGTAQLGWSGPPTTVAAFGGPNPGDVFVSAEIPATICWLSKVWVPVATGTLEYKCSANWLRPGVWQMEVVAGGWCEMSCF